MFTYNQSTATAESAAAVNTLVNDPTVAVKKALSQIVSKHQVCYEVWPEWSVFEGRKIQIGFELQLCGVNNHVLADGGFCHPVPGCSHCFRTYQEIRQIAAWVLPREERPSRYDIQAFDHALHMAPPKRQRRSEVVVTIVIMHRRDFNRPVDDCESRCLKEMRERLSQLGIRAEIWRGDE